MHSAPLGDITSEGAPAARAGEFAGITQEIDSLYAMAERMPDGSRKELVDLIDQREREAFSLVPQTGKDVRWIVRQLAEWLEGDPWALGWLGVLERAALARVAANVVRSEFTAAAMALDDAEEAADTKEGRAVEYRLVAELEQRLFSLRPEQPADWRWAGRRLATAVARGWGRERVEPLARLFDPEVDFDAIG